jgi:UDP-sulfoquinovose synthase
MRVTDLNQGVVYGIDTDETQLHADLATSFHYDAVFGTVLNRFITQAVHGVPLTVYGKGGQTRGFLNIRDTLRCVELALLNPADSGEFRVFNQFTEQFGVLELAERVKATAIGRGHGSVQIDHIDNPRIEMEEHYFNAKHSALELLGLESHLLTDQVIDHMIEVAEHHSDRIDRDVIVPDIKWKLS